MRNMLIAALVMASSVAFAVDKKSIIVSGSGVGGFEYSFYCANEGYLEYIKDTLGGNGRETKITHFELTPSGTFYIEATFPYMGKSRDVTLFIQAGAGCVISRY